jgi:hypothetical protein
MTVKQLVEELCKYPGNWDVYVAERKTEFAYGLVNSAYSKEITFSEDEDGEPLSKDTVVILDEE